MIVFFYPNTNPRKKKMFFQFKISPIFEFFCIYLSLYLPLTFHHHNLTKTSSKPSTISIVILILEVL